MRHLRPTLASAFALLPAVFACALAQAQDGSALDNLPPETVGALHLPDVGKYGDQLKATALGKTMMDAKRWQPVWDALEKADDKGEFKKFRAEMARLKLTNDDLTALFKHDAGLAVVMLKDAAPGKRTPQAVVLAWSGCGQPLAEKMKAAILDPKLRENDKRKFVRTDLTPALSRLRFGEYKADADPAANGAPKDETHEEIRPHRGEDTGYAYLAAQNGYLVAALGIDSVHNEADLAAFEKVATPLVAQFASSLGKPGAGAFSKRLAATPGIRQALAKPGTAPLITLLIDTPAVVKAVRNGYVAEHPDKSEQADKLIKGLGLDGAGPLAIASAAGPDRMTTSMAFDCAAPRRGLFRLLDQKQVIPQVPDWVGAEVVTYARYNFDLAAAYDIVVDSIKAASPTDEDAMQVDNGLAMMNGMVASQLGGLQARDLLAAFGGTVHGLQYAGAADKGADKDADGAAASPFAGAHSALVWPEAKPEVWNKVMAAMDRFMSKPDAPLYKANEQDYTGWASKNNEQMKMPFGFFLGKGGLVVGLGQDSARNAITGLAAPGKHNHLMEDCRGILPAREGWFHSFGDARQGAKDAIATFKSTAAAKRNFLGQPQDEKAKAVMDAINAALPTNQEVDAMLGMSAATGWTDGAGFHGESAMKLTPAK